MYKHFFKPLFDFFLSLLAIIVLSPFFILFTPIVSVAMKGNPFFIQKRPGKKGKIFGMIKYRSMTNAKDEKGNLLPDADRLTKFGKLMRKLSLDELPEIFNIFAGQMSIVGPRPQLVRDLVFFDGETMRRQNVRPGLTGWAQVSGRNNVTWEEKFELDDYYLFHMSLFVDIKILFLTVFKVFAHKDINTKGMETAEDYGDYLLRVGKINKIYYDRMREYAQLLLEREHYNDEVLHYVQTSHLIGSDKHGYAVLMSVYAKTNLAELKQSLGSIFAQNPAPAETIIVEDGPVSEDVAQYLCNLQSEGKVKLVPLEENVGLGRALAAGTEHCSCEWIARMDSDDICAPDRMEKQTAYLEAHPEVDVLGGNIAEFIDSPDDIVSKRIVPEDHEKICEYLKKRCPFNHMTVVIRKNALEKAGGYQHWHFNEDSYLWARMYLSGARFANLSDTLCYARVGEEMFKRRGGYSYYKSERDLFKFMYKNKIINWLEYQQAKFVRFTVQVLMPSNIRQWFFVKFARSKAPKNIDNQG